MTRKIPFILMLILSILTLGLVGSNSVEANEVEYTTVTLHKVLFGFGEMPEAYENTGEINEDFSDLPPLAGVAFEVYDVTENFQELILNKTHEEAQDILAKSGPGSLPLYASGITGRNGEVSFNLAREETSYKAYLFHEGDRPANVRERSSDFVIVVPFRNQAGEQLHPIHIYPKNESLEAIDFEKEIISERIAFDMGERIPYEMTTKVPAYPSDYERFIIRDTADDTLIFEPESLVVHIGGVVVGDVYTLNPTTHGFELIFDIKALEAFSDEALVVNYNMYLSENAIPDTDYYNVGELDYGHAPLVESTVVRTGGYRFEKVDRTNQNIKLSGAHFIVRNNDGNYLVVRGGRYIWQENREGATELVSGVNGSIEMIGLKYGRYSLVEVKAPTGYILSSTPISFNISNGSYVPGAVMRIINQARPKTPGRLPITGGEEEPPERPRLPITGQESTIIFSLIGTLFIVSALVILSKQNSKRGNNS